MFDRLKAVLWDNRNEPFLVVIGASLVVILLWAVGLQMRREAPLVCGSTILPASLSLV